MATYTKYEPFVEHFSQKLIDAFGTTDTWRAVIHTDAPTVATDAALADLTEIGNSNGYTTGGEDITFNATRSGGTVTSTATDVIWTASGGSPLGNSTTGRYVSIYDDTATGNWLLCSYDYGSTFTVASGETFTLDFGASLYTFA
jgi:hypothetical protein